MVAQSSSLYMARNLALPHAGEPWYVGALPPPSRFAARRWRARSEISFGWDIQPKNDQFVRGKIFFTVKYRCNK